MQAQMTISHNRVCFRKMAAVTACLITAMLLVVVEVAMEEVEPGRGALG